MKYFQFLIILVYSNILLGQQFVNPSNEWFADDCCYAVGQTYCTTYKYWFEGPVSINSVVYYELKSNNQNPIFLLEYKGYYREDNGLVYTRSTENEEEYVIYDFNLTVGEQLEIGNSDYSHVIEILSVDSITLISGERRKRLEVGDASFPDTKTYWIEGVGSALSPMNTLYMFSLDCWNDFNCFHTDNIVEYQMGSCQLTSSKSINLPENKISCYPNPVTSELIISTVNNDKTERIEIVDIRGNTIFQVISEEMMPVDVSGFPAGMYFAKVTFKNGKMGISRFVKAAN